MSKDVPEDRRRGKEREINKTTSREIKVRKIGLKMTEINNNNNKEYDKREKQKKNKSRDSMQETQSRNEERNK
jgi:hypothetical protein